MEIAYTICTLLMNFSRFIRRIMIVRRFNEKKLIIGGEILHLFVAKKFSVFF